MCSVHRSALPYRVDLVNFVERVAVLCLFCGIYINSRILYLQQDTAGVECWPCDAMPVGGGFPGHLTCTVVTIKTLTLSLNWGCNLLVLCYHTLQVTRYLEFKTVDGSYVVKGGKVNKVRHRHRGRGSNQQVVAVSFLTMTFATRPAQAHSMW